MQLKNLLKIFFIITLFSILLLIIILYKEYKFKTNPISHNIKQQLAYKESEIKQKINLHYNISLDIPVIIKNNLPNNLFGFTTYKNKKIYIYLNKKRFQENKNYMINYVLAHEYAHALMFYFKDFTKANGGHTKKWQQICKNIGGEKCDRFVNNNDILIEKIGVFHPN